MELAQKLEFTKHCSAIRGKKNFLHHFLLKIDKRLIDVGVIVVPKKLLCLNLCCEIIGRKS